jgi:hypothetical protein
LRNSSGSTAAVQSSCRKERTSSNLSGEGIECGRSSEQFRTHMYSRERAILLGWWSKATCSESRCIISLVGVLVALSVSRKRDGGRIIFVPSPYKLVPTLYTKASFEPRSRFFKSFGVFSHRAPTPCPCGIKRPRGKVLRIIGVTNLLDADTL